MANLSLKYRPQMTRKPSLLDGWGGVLREMRWRVRETACDGVIIKRTAAADAAANRSTERQSTVRLLRALAWFCAPSAASASLQNVRKNHHAQVGMTEMVQHQKP
eukprot:1177381-Prorocentrum_minimum.AAC.2